MRSEPWGWIKAGACKEWCRSRALWVLQCHGCQGHVWRDMLEMPLQSAADEPSTTGSGRVLTGAKGAGIGHRQTEMFENHPPKELTSCHLKPAHCFYSIQMFSSILSLPYFLPFLSAFLPSLPPFPPVRVWMACQRNIGHSWSVIPLRFLLHYFQVPEWFDISTVTHSLLSIIFKASPKPPCMWCCLRACQDQLIHPLCGSQKNKMFVILLYSDFQLVFRPTRLDLLTTVHAYTFFGP